MTEYNTILIGMVLALILGSYIWVWYESSLTITDAEKMLVDKKCRDYLQSFQGNLNITDSYLIRKLSGNRFQVKYIVFDGFDTQAMRATLLVKMEGTQVLEINASIDGSI